MEEVKPKREEERKGNRKGNRKGKMAGLGGGCEIVIEEPGP